MALTGHLTGVGARGMATRASTVRGIIPTTVVVTIMAFTMATIPVHTTTYIAATERMAQEHRLTAVRAILFILLVQG